MKLYHLDRTGTLCDNKDIPLTPVSELNSDIQSSLLFESFSHGVSQHCIKMTSNIVSSMQPIIIPFGSTYHHFLDTNTLFRQYQKFNSHIIEFVFEIIRQAKFPDMPSRYTCLFAVEKISDFRQWPELTYDLSSNFQIFEIEVPELPHHFDSSLLRGGVIFNSDQFNDYNMGFLPTRCYDFACQYWSGKTSDNPRFEYLIPLPIAASAIRKLDSSEYDNILGNSSGDK